MAKSVDDYMKMHYHVRVVCDDGTFVAEVLELPGCITEADSHTELVDMVDDAMRCWISCALEDNQIIPEPKATETWMLKDESGTTFVCLNCESTGFHKLRDYENLPLFVCNGCGAVLVTDYTSKDAMAVAEQMDWAIKKFASKDYPTVAWEGED